MDDHTPLPVYDPNDPRMPPSLPLFLRVSQVGKCFRAGAGLIGLLVAASVSYSRHETVAEIGSHMAICGAISFVVAWGLWLALVTSIRQDVVNDLDALRRGATQSGVESE